MDFNFHEDCPECGCEWNILNISFLDKEHIKKLTWLVSRSPDLRDLVESITNAKHFINIASGGLDLFFIGALSVKCPENCEINIVVMKPQRILKKFADAMYEIRDKIRYNPESHTKLIVVDGILAFKGTANATFKGWTRGPWEEIRETVTRPVDVQKLNNEFFVRIFRFARPILNNSITLV